MSSLQSLRDRLNAVDRHILELAAERRRIVADIGRTKLESGTGTRDFDREKQVIEGGRAHARELELPEDLAEEILQTLIRSSLTQQESARISASNKGADRRALIIGGNGQMGRWFARFMASQGFAVDIADPTGVPDGFSALNDWQTADLDHDIIVVATPLAVSREVLNSLLQIRPPGLIFDIASLKSPLREPLRRLADAGLRVTSLHPMFGPDTELLSDRHIIFVDLGEAQATADARALFESTMARQVAMSLEDHDRLVAYILGLSHALNIAFFTALSESGEAADALADLSSTTFDAQLDVSRKVASENPHLYFEIQALNDYRAAPLRALSDAVNRLIDVVDSNDEAAFVRMMERGRRYFSR